MRVPGAAALMLVVALSAGCTSEPPQGPRSSPDRLVNKSLTLKQKNGSALVTLVSVVESYVTDDYYASKPQSGNFVVVGLSFEHKTGEYSPSKVQFTLRTPNRETVTNSRSPLPFDKQFRSTTDSQLSAGRFLSGMIAFDTTYYPTLTLQAVDASGFIVGQWPLSGGEPIEGDGSFTRQISQSLTVKSRGSSAVITLVSLTQSTGGTRANQIPQSGAFIAARMRIEGTTGGYTLHRNVIRLRKPNGRDVTKYEGNGPHGVPADEQVPEYETIDSGEVVKFAIAFDTQPSPGSKLVIVDAGGHVVAEWPV
nr:hypothetical protein [Kibdelosporangium sp. MJ126-NF4]CEL14223.1 hypothetical protein [Kibdelosporangium sp. MJ126-NF4]CTQ88591.1 hypothetical protein [Kibdelosporangium sp. MJ126-NF4]